MATSAPTPPKAMNTSIRGLHMRYYVWDGRGPAVVLLHPSRGYGRMWDFVVPYLLTEFRVIAPDQRGHGDTDKPPAGQYAGEDFAQDLGALLDQLGLRQVILVGHSLGGRVAQIFAGLHPERVTKMVLAGGPHAESFFPTAEPVREVLKRAQAAEETPQSFSSEQTALEYLRRAFPDLNDKMKRHMIEFNMNRHADGSLSLKFDAVKVAETLRHIPDNLTKYVERITCPVLFSVRNQGPHQLSLKQVDDIVRLYKNTKVEIVRIDGVYLVEMEDPDGVGKTTRDFLLR